MSFPNASTQVSTDNLDAGSDNPGLARADLYQAVGLLNEIIAGQNDAGGVAVLDYSGKIPSTRLPQTISLVGAGAQTFSPDSGVVEIQSVLRLAPLLRAQINDVSTATYGAGLIAYCLDGITTGTDCLVIWNGTAWKTLAFTGTLA